MSVNLDIERSNIVDHINGALSASRSLHQDLLIYLLEMALVEARTTSEPPSVLLRRPGRPSKRL